MDHKYGSTPKLNRITSFNSFIISFSFLILFSISSCSGNTPTPRPITQEERKAMEAVQSQRTVMASDMHKSIGFVLAFLETEGHSIGIDGWYVGTSSDYYFVKFYFYLDGKREYAEWWYYLDHRIIPKNEWAYVLMGE